MNEYIVPKENIEIYSILYEIETALRELLIDVLTKIDGSKWYKNRLSGDILKKYRESKNFEKNITWTQIIPHHPIYYISKFKVQIKSKEEFLTFSYLNFI